MICKKAEKDKIQSTSKDKLLTSSRTEWKEKRMDNIEQVFKFGFGKTRKIFPGSMGIGKEGSLKKKKKTLTLLAKSKLK
jgi:hypothetical protein